MAVLQKHDVQTFSRRWRPGPGPGGPGFGYATGVGEVCVWSKKLGTTIWNVSCLTTGPLRAHRCVCITWNRKGHNRSCCSNMINRSWSQNETQQEIILVHILAWANYMYIYTHCTYTWTWTWTWQVWIVHIRVWSKWYLCMKDELGKVMNRKSQAWRWYLTFLRVSPTSMNLLVEGTYQIPLTGSCVQPDDRRLQSTPPLLLELYLPFTATSQDRRSNACCNRSHLVYVGRA